MSKKVRHNLFRNSKSQSKFGLLKFDEEGFVIEPDLDDEQIEEICTIPNFVKVEEEEQQEDGQEDDEKEDAGEDSKEEEKQEEPQADEDKEDVNEDDEDSEEDEEEVDFESMTVKELKAFAFENDIELEKTRKDEIIAEIKEGLENK
jgi:hypothetical protein